MALEDGNGNGMIMPVAPMYGGGYGGYGNGWGGFGGDGWWVILFLFAMMGGWGNGFGGGFGGGNMMLPYFFNNTDNNTQRGFDTSTITSQLGDIRNAISSGFATAEVASCDRAMNSMQTAYQNQISDLERSFNAQTAVTGAITGVQSALQKCCCDNELQTESLRATVLQENCQDRYEAQSNTRDIIANQTAGFQRILDQMCNDKIDAKNEKITELQTQLTMRDLAASQAAQTAALVADNTAQTRDLIQRIAPYPTPSFIVGNPYGYNNYWNNGWNNGCGCGFGNNYGYGVA